MYKKWVRCPSNCNNTPQGLKKKKKNMPSKMIASSDKAVLYIMILRGKEPFSDKKKKKVWQLAGDNIIQNTISPRYKNSIYYSFEINVEGTLEKKKKNIQYRLGGRWNDLFGTSSLKFYFLLLPLSKRFCCPPKPHRV